jgi:ribosome-associated heat shock protein Hsp15
MSEPRGGDRQRIDKWLWLARVVKSRTLAQKLVVGGRVRVNRERSDSASQLVKVGDTLTIGLESGVRVLRIVAPGSRRGPPTEARTLFEDLSPAPVQDPVAAAEVRDPGSGRPTKRDRRALTALKRGGGDDFAEGED